MNENLYKGIVKGLKGNEILIKTENDIKLPTYLKNERTGLYDVVVALQDHRMITHDQRGYIYGLFHDISEYTGYPMEYVKDVLKSMFSLSKGWESFSLAYNGISKSNASEFIEYILEFCFENEIPFRHMEYFVGSEHTRMLFLYLKYRKCFISGEKGDVAHCETVGMGRNRNKIDHSKHHFLCLSRKYHIEQHTIGLKAFLKKYKLVPIKLTKEQIKEFKIGGIIDELH